MPSKLEVALIAMAQDAFKNLVQGIVEKADEIKNKQSFIDILDKHATAEAIGAESRSQAIRSVIREFNDKGIPAFVDKRGRQWTPEAYVGMTLRTTANNVSTEAMFARMEDRGFSLIQISSHSGASPKCARDQGKIFDRNNGSGEVEDGRGRKIRYYPWRSSSYGEPDGLFGINCGHHGTPFIPGVSSQRYFPTDDLEENAREYKKMQTQRALERDVRKQKRLCSLYDEIGDKESFEEASVTLKRKEARLADYTKKNGLTRRKDREQVAKSFKRDAIAKDSYSGRIMSGARITNIFSEEADEFAKMYYAEIRSFSTDTQKIAKNLNKSEADIRKVKAYLFEDESLVDPDTGERRRFDPDCAIAQSWQRLMIGKDIKQHDRTLIEHELYEMKIKHENPGIDHQKAHELATKKYDYRGEVKKYYGNLKKHQKNEG